MLSRKKKSEMLTFFTSFLGFFLPAALLCLLEYVFTAPRVSSRIRFFSAIISSKVLPPGKNFDINKYDMNETKKVIKIIP